MIYFLLRVYEFGEGKFCETLQKGKYIYETVYPHVCVRTQSTTNATFRRRRTHTIIFQRKAKGPSKQLSTKTDILYGIHRYKRGDEERYSSPKMQTKTLYTMVWSRASIPSYTISYIVRRRENRKKVKTEDTLFGYPWVQ